MSRTYEKDIFVVPHPDDSEAMLGHRIAQSQNPWVIVATDGKASTVDLKGNGFVESGRRREESYHGLEYLGVPRNQQLYLSLPDGELENHIPQLRDAILEAMSSCAVNSLVTLGPDGYDDHPDHKASHNAALMSACELDPDKQPDIFALNSQHSGRHVAGGHTWKKLTAMAHHQSQFDLDNPDFWQEFEPYAPLICQQETYDLIRIR
jgi:LmbE family N-acetylglucosaminyl deacetylase